MGDSRGGGDRGDEDTNIPPQSELSGDNGGILILYLPPVQLKIGDHWWICRTKKVAGVWVWNLISGPHTRALPWMEPEHLEMTLEQVKQCTQLL